MKNEVCLKLILDFMKIAESFFMSFGSSSFYNLTGDVKFQISIQIKDEMSAGKLKISCRSNSKLSYFTKSLTSSPKPPK